MEVKKNPSIDVEGKSMYFFSIGLVIALSLVITAFEWESHPSLDIIGCQFNQVDETLIIPTTIINQPPVPRLASNSRIIEVSNAFSEDSILHIPDILDYSLTPTVEAPAPPIEEIDVIVDFVEEPASPLGGFSKLYKAISEQIKYPAQARRGGIDGRVFIQFIVNRDGSLSNLSLIKGIGGGCDEEAMRVVQSLPAWTPARKAGRTVRQRFTLPINFKLEQ